jgi:prepilin-type N-terminal cleavage/methylation domain-containing protein/prepilin-type processing-associated H-X9-DG protein
MMMSNVPLKLCRISVGESRAAKRGFTLIELLTVMAILILLLALLIPQLSKVQEESRRAGCRSNLRQLGAGMLLFAGDHNGWLPARQMSHPPGDRDGEYDRRYPQGFTYHILLLAGIDAATGAPPPDAQGRNAPVYIEDPRLWICPSDRVNGNNDQIRIQPAKAITRNPPAPFRSTHNASYLYVAGYNVTSYSAPHSAAPLLADESNETEDGNLQGGDMPPLGPTAAHGANFRNVLFLDGSVVAIDDENAANAIFDQVPAHLARKLQSVD